jgi:hypothetical protein
LIRGCIHADIFDNSETRPPSRVALISEISKTLMLASMSEAEQHCVCRIRHHNGRTRRCSMQRCVFNFSARHRKHTRSCGSSEVTAIVTAIPSNCETATEPETQSRMRPPPREGCLEMCYQHKETPKRFGRETGRYSSSCSGDREIYKTAPRPLNRPS